MNQNTRQRLSQQIQKLIDEGQDVLSTTFYRSGPGFVDMNDPYVESQVFRKWLTNCRNFVLRIGAPAQVWIDSLENVSGNRHVMAKTVQGVIQSLKEAIEDDLLARVDDLVTADAFGSLLEQADELQGKGYMLAAGVLGRAVLEEHLRKMCDRHNCLPTRRPTINDLNQALYKAQHLDKLAMQGVTAMATAGNHCAHNDQPPLSGQDVQKCLDDVRAFLIRHPLS